MPQNIIDGIVNKYSEKLASSGYEVEQIRRIVTAGLKGFEKMVKKQISGQSKIHRSAGSSLTARNRKKLLGKTSWFRSRGKQDKDQAAGQDAIKTTTSRQPRGKMAKVNTEKGNQKTTSSQPRTSTVLFVEQTPGGALANMFRQAEKYLAELTGFRVKIAEKNGTKIVHILHQSNPWAEGKCSRSGCLPCDTGDQKCCFKRNIVYKNTCILCKKEGKDAVYIGESSRSSNERATEHLNDFKRSKTDSHMYKHTETAHPLEDEHNFEFRVVKTFSSALMRQVTEAVLIRRQEGQY